MDYTIHPCNACNKAVKEKIFGSVGPSEVARPVNLEFTILTPMKFTKAALMKIKLRSYQVTAEGDYKGDLPSLTINEDGDVVNAGILYVKNGSVNFEYQMQVYMEDGTKYESGWIQSNSAEVVIGSQQIRENISHFSNK